MKKGQAFAPLAIVVAFSAVLFLLFYAFVHPDVVTYMVNGSIEYIRNFDWRSLDMAVLVFLIASAVVIYFLLKHFTTTLGKEAKEESSPLL